MPTSQDLEDQNNLPNTPPSGDEGSDTQNQLDTDMGDQQDDQSGQSKKTAEARINELVSEVKQYKDRLQEIEGRMSPPPPPPVTQDPGKITPEAQRAQEFLRNTLGFVQKDDFEQRIQTIEERIALNNEHSRLERSFDGNDGRPKYVRSDIEKYMRDRGVFDPEVAYKALHETELNDWLIKQAEEKRKTRPYVEKPGGTTTNRGSNEITREMIQKKVFQDGDMDWYEKHRKEILELNSKGLL